MRISQNEKAADRNRLAFTRRGFTLFEILLAVALIGVMALIFYPNIMNTLETRRLENSAKELLGTMQMAKFQAVRTKLNHRVKFENENAAWFFTIQREDAPAQWSVLHGFIRKAIPSQFNVNVNFPIVNEDGESFPVVEFSPLGLVSNFNSLQNSITLQSLKLEINKQPDERVINVFAGGSIQYLKPEEE